MERQTYANFTPAELACRHSGELNPNIQAEHALMSDIQLVRDIVNEPMPVTSAYRCATHPDEINKVKPGTHNKAAIDLGVSFVLGHKTLQVAMALPYIKLIERIAEHVLEHGGIDKKSFDRMLNAAKYHNGVMPASFNGIGIHQKGDDGRFLHFDKRGYRSLWTY